MMKKRCCLLLCLILLPLVALGEEPLSFLDDAEADRVGKIIRTYDSPTLKYSMETFTMSGETCFLTRIWVKEPARQIRKVTSDWKKNLKFPKTLMMKLPEAVLAINGSGYVSPQYPEIPDNYPGESEDYFFTPLGSVTVTDGEVFRNLEGVPYYGLALDEDGLQMYTGADNGDVLATNPVQTWSFYTTCPMLRNNIDLLPEEWPFADRRACRTIIGRLDGHTYLILSANDAKKGGITLRRAVEFFQDNFNTEWVYNLDGGPSSALMYWKKGTKKPHTVMGAGVKDADIMAFTE